MILSLSYMVMQIKEPVVCGISSLGMDHMDILGDTLGKIASHKAGIFKPNVPAFTVPQLPEAMDVIKERAQQLRDVREGDLPDAFLRGLSSAHLPGRAQIVYDVVSKSSKTTGDLIYYLDGAPSPESMDACAKWFSKVVNGHQNSTSLPSSKSSSEDRLRDEFNKTDFTGCEKENKGEITKQILLFNCMEERNPQILLQKLVETCASSGVHFAGALFVPSISTYNKVVSGSSNMLSHNLSWQYNLQRIWEKTINGKEIDLNRNDLTECIKNESSDALPPLEFLHGDSLLSSAAVPSLPLAIQWLRHFARENPSFRLQVLVTGSLHLVGDVLKLLRR